MNRPPVLNQEQALKAVAVAESIGRGEPLARDDQRWLMDLLLGLANDALEYRPAHRKADNSGRDFYAAMDYLLAGEVQKVVARRWGVTPAALGKIVNRMRHEVEKIIAESSATPATWLRVVAVFRDRIPRSSVTKGLSKG